MGAVNAVPFTPAPLCLWYRGIACLLAAGAGLVLFSIAVSARSGG